MRSQAWSRQVAICSRRTSGSFRTSDGGIIGSREVTGNGATETRASFVNRAEWGTTGSVYLPGRSKSSRMAAQESRTLECCSAEGGYCQLEVCCGRLDSQGARGRVTVGVDSLPRSSAMVGGYTTVSAPASSKSTKIGLSNEAQGLLQNEPLGGGRSLTLSTLGRVKRREARATFSSRRDICLGLASTGQPHRNQNHHD